MMFPVGYVTKTMYYSWLKNPVEYYPGVKMPQFTIVDTLLTDCTVNYTGGKEWLPFLASN